MYDSIGTTYSTTRRADPRIAAMIDEALGSARTVVNVGAGSGSYEPPHRSVIAVEPSATMTAQRPADAAPVVRGVAGALPFGDGTFDAALCSLTIHHWPDLGTGLAELARVSRRQVIFLFDPAEVGRLWVTEYFPEALAHPAERSAPGPSEVADHLDVERIDVVPVPSDCIDGFAAAFWARPEAYTDPGVQAGMSWLARLDDDTRALGTARLRADLDAGRWDTRHGHLRTIASFDVGYRLLVARGPRR
ncbi:MAG: class I SAM-dependent methyltransferase [Actinomycetota bacterium]|nr:class I SAM-dependent methyltransferase [Actinomycetota bacterium]